MSLVPIGYRREHNSWRSMKQRCLIQKTKVIIITESAELGSVIAGSIHLEIFFLIWAISLAQNIL
jgi:hypothetical protein